LANDRTLCLYFPIPPAIPTGTLKLIAYHRALSVSGQVIKYTISDGDCTQTTDPSATTLTAETQTSLTLSATSGIYNVVKTTLTATPLVNDTLVVALKYQTSGWTLAVALWSKYALIWE
jgi:hypothetical protein